MKTTCTILKGILAAVMLCSVNVLTAQVPIEISDGGIVNLSGKSSPYTSLTITSTTSTNSSTALLKSVADGSNKTVTLDNTCTLTDYYGKISLGDETTFEIQTSSAVTIPCKFDLSGPYTSATTLKLSSTFSGLAFTGYNYDGTTLLLGDYGILDLSGSTKDILLSKSVKLNGYQSNAPYIKYAPDGDLSSALSKLVISDINETFTSSETDGKIFASKHFYIDLTDATASSLSATAYPVVQLTETVTSPVLSATDLTPTVTGNSDDAWVVGDMTVTNPTGSRWNVNVVLTFSPLFMLDDLTYARDWNAMMAYVNSGGYGFQDLLKNKTTGLGSVTVTNNLSIDLNTYTLGGASQAFTINDGKTLTFKKDVGGNFDGQLIFGGVSSRIRLTGSNLSDNIFGSNFAGTGTFYGTLAIGDGTIFSSYTHSLSGTKITTANKIGKIVVNSGATMTVNP